MGLHTRTVCMSGNYTKQGKILQSKTLVHEICNVSGKYHFYESLNTF